MVKNVKAAYTCDFARCDCHPGVCNKLTTVYAAKYTLIIRYILSLTLSSVKHILQDVNCKTQNRKQLFRVSHRSSEGCVLESRLRLKNPLS